jgi:D-serine deaminase-like pyridoxal phosphate-dependent protein
MTIPAAAEVGMPLSQVDTPCLMLELDAFERNLRRLPDSLKGRDVRLRPHAKSHKSADIALRQIALGAAGVCVQKVSEAAALIEAGVKDILIANEVVGAPKLELLAGLNRRAHVAVCADDAGNVSALDAAARAAGVSLDVLVEVDVGANRCGVQPGGPAVALAAQISRASNLRFAGLQAYQGSAQHIRSVGERQEAITRAVDYVRMTTRMLTEAGMKCEYVTGAGTGSYMFEAASNVYHEIQAGSYIFMDADYAKNDWTESGMPQFEHSLFVWTTVMSTPAPARAVVDAGLKASSIDSGMPRVAQQTDVEYVKASDEHGVLNLTGATRFKVGDKLLLIPGHCDPTVNLYDRYVCVRNGRVEALWPVTARGALL